MPGVFYQAPTPVQGALYGNQELLPPHLIYLKRSLEADDHLRAAVLSSVAGQTSHPLRNPGWIPRGSDGRDERTDGKRSCDGARRPAVQSMVETAPKELFETHCGVCHSLELPRSQRLDRNTWRWVMDDMVNKYGTIWITEKQQERIIVYLAENHGPH